jgi:hypothetical protein
MKRFLAWWRARRMRTLYYNAHCAAANYMAAKARYENALLEDAE